MHAVLIIRGPKSTNLLGSFPVMDADLAAAIALEGFEPITGYVITRVELVSDEALGCGHRGTNWPDCNLTQGTSKDHLWQLLGLDGT